MTYLNFKNKNPIITNNLNRFICNIDFMKSGGDVHRTDIIPGVVDSNSKLDNMKNNYKTPKKKKYIKKKQEGGQIEVSEFNPIQISLKKFQYPEINYEDSDDLDLSNFQLANTPIIINTHVQETSKTDPNLKNLSLEQLLKEEGVKAKITSGFRKGAKTSQGKDSNHSHLDDNGHAGAYDIVPTDGNFENLRKEIYGNPRIVQWLKQKGWGILEETSKEVMNKTGATGKHWHFGPDTAAVNMSKQNGIDYAKLGIKIKKKNQGSFTKYCDGKVTQDCIDQAKKSKSKSLRKKAIFAENARSWKHQQGGQLSYFKQYGINQDKLIDMFNALREKGLPNQVAFETTWQSIKEKPDAYYSFGRKAQNLQDWANKANYSLTKGIYKAAKDSINFNDFRNKTFQYNKQPTYTKWLKTGRDSGKQFINKYIKDNDLGQPITLIPNSNNLI